MGNNETLTKEFPFLRSEGHSRCVFKDDIPRGWWECFGLAYLNDLKEVLKRNNCLDEFYFSQVKEKYGTLCAYNYGAPSEWLEHEYAWEYISEHTCVECGKFPVPMRYLSWISPYCDEHVLNGKDWIEDKRDITEKNWDGRPLEYLAIKHFSKDGDYQELIDMKPYYDKIGWNYTKDDLLNEKEKEVS